MIRHERPLRAKEEPLTRIAHESGVRAARDRFASLPDHWRHSVLSPSEPSVSLVKLRIGSIEDSAQQAAFQLSEI